MARSRPNPDGWQGGSEDFEYVRTLDGHMGINVETPGDQAADINWRRNAKTWEQADLGSE